MFDIHAKELIVGEIFVRVYNEQPTFQLEVGIFCTSGKHVRVIYTPSHPTFI